MPKIAADDLGDLMWIDRGTTAAVGGNPTFESEFGVYEAKTVRRH
jgi:hypothetical protein